MQFYKFFKLSFNFSLRGFHKNKYYNDIAEVRRSREAKQFIQGH